MFNCAYHSPGLEMRTCCLLLMFVVVRAVALDCGEVRTVTQLNVTQLSGRWVVLEWVPLWGGVASSQVTSDDPVNLSPRCATCKLKSNDTTLSIKASMHMDGGDKVIRRSQFTVTQPGRWTGQINDDMMLVLAADPENYLVLLYCVPGEFTEVPARVSFLSRHQRSADTEDQLQRLRDLVVQVIEVTEVKPIKMETDCFRG